MVDGAALSRASPGRLSSPRGIPAIPAIPAILVTPAIPVTHEISEIPEIPEARRKHRPLVLLFLPTKAPGPRCLHSSNRTTCP